MTLYALKRVLQIVRDHGEPPPDMPDIARQLQIRGVEAQLVVDRLLAFGAFSWSRVDDAGAVHWQFRLSDIGRKLLELLEEVM